MLHSRFSEARRGFLLSLFAACLLFAAPNTAQANQMPIDCGLALKLGAGYIEAGNIINGQLKLVEDVKDPIVRTALRRQLRAMFKSMESAFQDLKWDYNHSDCGSGDFERDLGGKFPPMNFWE